MVDAVHRSRTVGADATPRLMALRETQFNSRDIDSVPAEPS